MELNRWRQRAPILLFVFLLCSSRAQTISGGGYRSNNEVAVREHRKVVFWHVSNTDEVVDDQLEEMKEKALKIAHVVKWLAYPPTSQKALAKLRSMPSSSFQEVSVPARFKSRERSFFEFPTLVMLHQHCIEHPLDYVAYAHTKTQRNARRTMMRQLFGKPHCIDGCLDRGKAACGVNLKQAHGGPRGFPSTWCHFSGNFWWATCAYIKTLNSPWADSLSEELILQNPTGFKGESDKKQKGWKNLKKEEKHILHNHHDSRAFGRYFAEWWLLNDVRYDVIKSFAGVTAGWLAAYEPDNNQVIRRSHIVKIRSPEQCFTLPADQAIANHTCATDAARRLAAIHGAEAIWHWPKTCPVSVGYGDLESSVCRTSRLAP